MARTVPWHSIADHWGRGSAAEDPGPLGRRHRIPIRVLINKVRTPNAALRQHVWRIMVAVLAAY